MNPFLSTLLEGAWPGLLAAGLMLVVLPWSKPEGRMRILILGFAGLLSLRYAYWRLTATLPPMEETVNFIAGSTFFAIEFAAIVGSLLSLMTLTRTQNRSIESDRMAGWIRKQDPLPTVDLFICTYNEEREILERTIIGAMAIDYPNKRVWVLDDGRRQWLRDLSADLGCNYLDRPDNSHAKAGNINNALAHVAGLDTPPDFISILDADFVPTKNFLWRTLALFHEEDVGIVQTPQHFVNPDPIQANLLVADSWPDEQRYFFDVVMPAKDGWGTAFCCGTSSVLRAKALYGIGGFPTTSVTEDYLVTLSMLKNGYRTVYLNERLSLGLAPEGLKEYVTQRSRWCLGFIQIFRSNIGPFGRNNGLRLLDRLALIESFLYWSASYLFRIAGFIIPILYLLFDIHAVDVALVEGISYFLPYYIAHIAVIAWLSERRILPVMTDLSQLLAAREVLSAVFIGLIKPRGHKFKVTAKGGDRSKIFVQWRMMSLFLTLLIGTLLSILYAFTFDADRTLQDSSVVALFWGWYNCAVLIMAVLVCIERPRVRRDERLKTREMVTLMSGTETRDYEMLDISISGLRLGGQSFAPLGTDVEVRIGRHVLEGHIVRQSRFDFAVLIKESASARAKMIRHVYSGTYLSGVGDIRAAVVARQILARIFQ